MYYDPSGYAMIRCTKNAIKGNNPNLQMDLEFFGSSKKLRGNMKKAGIKEPKFSNAAHHIVAEKAKKAEKTRKILNKFGIDINDPANGVFLPTNQHRRIHTTEYYKKVQLKLMNIRTKESIIRELKKIAEEILNNTF
jgi:hypothetical protein